MGMGQRERERENKEWKLERRGGGGRNKEGKQERRRRRETETNRQTIRDRETKRNRERYREREREIRHVKTGSGKHIHVFIRKITMNTILWAKLSTTRRLDNVPWIVLSLSLPLSVTKTKWHVSDVSWCMIVWCTQNLGPDGSNFTWHQTCNNKTAL